MKNVSFVVQGKIQENTKSCLSSIRQYYPESTIILSTWETEIIDGLPYDVIVQSKDPGAIECAPGYYYNLNRQIISTLHGLKMVKTELAVKMRTDTRILERKLSELLRNMSQGELLTNKVLALNLFFRDPRKFPLLFHIGDIFHFGKTCDLLNLWDIPLTPEPETSSWNVNRFNIFNEFHSYKPRYTPEQYIFIAFLNKYKINISLDYCCEINFQKLRCSETSIANNFDIFSLEELGINIPSRLVIEMRSTDIYTRTLLNSISQNTVNWKHAKGMIRRRKWRLIRSFMKNPILWVSFFKNRIQHPPTE